MVTKEILLPTPLDAAQKPYYCGSKNQNLGAVFATMALLGVAPVRSTRASAANHRKSSAFSHDDLGVANSKVTTGRGKMIKLIIKKSEHLHETKDLAAKPEDQYRRLSAWRPWTHEVAGLMTWLKQTVK
jgi:hypothetical protein